MIKSDITTSINTIDNGGGNTAAEVRTVLGNIRDAYYGDVVNDTQAVNTVTTPSDPTDVQYNLLITKQGRIVTVLGWVKNNTAGIVSTVNVCTFDGDYQGNSSLFFGNSVLNKVKATIFDSEFQILGSMAANETLYFDFNFFTTN